MVDVEEGIRRATFPLPFGLDHVHCYFLRSRAAAGSSSTPASASRDRRASAGGRCSTSSTRRSSGSSSRTCIPTTSVAPRDVADADAARRCCRGARTTSSASARGASATRSGSSTTGSRTACPPRRSTGSLRESERLVDAVHWVRDPQLLDAGDEIDGWRVEVLPRPRRRPHRAPARRRDDRRRHDPRRASRPRSGSIRNSRPDPLGDYLETLQRIESARAAGRVRGAQGADPRPGGPRARDHRAPPRAARRHRRRARRRAALGLRRLARALRARPLADAAPLRDRRVACAPGAARPRGARRAGRAPLHPRLRDAPPERGSAALGRGERRGGGPEPGCVRDLPARPHRCRLDGRHAGG